MKNTPIRIKSLYLKAKTKQQTDQLLNLKKFATLDTFLRNYQIQAYGQLIIIPEKDYDLLLVQSGISPKMLEIPIWYDSTIIYCTIVKGTIEALKEKLSNKLISVETFDDCVKKFNLK